MCINDIIGTHTAFILFSLRSCKNRKHDQKMLPQILFDCQLALHATVVKWEYIILKHPSQFPNCFFRLFDFSRRNPNFSPWLLEFGSAIGRDCVVATCGHGMYRDLFWSERKWGQSEEGEVMTKVKRAGETKRNESVKVKRTIEVNEGSNGLMA